MKLEVRRMAVGPLEANCYLVWDADAPAGADGARPCAVIDPGDEPDAILAALREEGLRPRALLGTHCHADHIGAVDDLLAAFPDAAWMVGEPERDWPGKPSMNLSYAFGLAMKMHPPTRVLKDGDEIDCGGLALRALSVPGHSPGSICYYSEAGKAVFTGDTLMAGDMGRGDLPGGNMELLIKSIRDKILSLPDDTVVWPGHTNRTRVGAEKLHNPCFNGGMA